MASESIEDDPVNAKATNLLTAIPRFASSAATTALIPPSVLTDPLSLRGLDDGDETLGLDEAVGVLRR
jgi:hypothetical protein